MDELEKLQAARRTAATLQNLQQGLGDILSTVANVGGLVADRIGLSTLFGVTCQADSHISSFDTEIAAERIHQDDDDGLSMSATTTLLLRLCVHHGEEMPLDKTCLQVVVEPHSEKTMKSFSSRVASYSKSPVWDFIVEHELEVRAGKRPTIEIKVLSPRLIGPRELGSAFLLPNVRGGQVHRQELPFKESPSLFPTWKSASNNAKLMVAWQLCDPNAFKPDLSRVAEMTAMAMTKRSFSMQVIVKQISLFRGIVSIHHGLQADFSLRVSCAKVDEAGEKEEAVIFSEELPSERRQDNSGSGSAKNIVCTCQSEPTSWEIIDNEVGLASHEFQLEAWLQPTVASTQKGGQLQKKALGRWKESLANLNDKISLNQRKQHIRAELRNEEETRVGYVDFIFDIVQPGEDVHDDPSIRTENGKEMQDMQAIKVSSGLFGKEWETSGTFHVSVAAFGLRTRSPVLRVYSAHGRHECNMSAPLDGNDEWLIEFSQALPVAISQARQKVRIEVWSENNLLQTLHAQDRLIGEASVYAPTPGRCEWRHLYGGAVTYNYARAEEQMTRGRIAPSTYHGSLLLSFSQRAHGTPMEDLITKYRVPAQLTVKLYRGLYLDMYAGQDVNVLIQVAGCTLNWDGRHNLNLLSFPAKVDDEGIMRFQADDSFFSLGEDNGWVERTTPKEERLGLPRTGAANHVCVYIVVKGEEDRPPKAFGRLRLSVGMEERPPQWSRVTCDQSVVQLPPQDKLFKDDLAGFLLGSARVVRLEDKQARSNSRLDDEGSSDANARSSFKELAKKMEVMEELVVTSKGKALMTKPGSVLCQPCTGERILQIGHPGTEVKRSKQPPLKDRKEVYCHIDMLTARCLPAADEDGLCDVSYEIRVGDKAVLYDDTPLRSLNPIFMHRMVIGPVEVEADAEGELLDLPPIVIKLLDKDEGRFGTDEFELLGRAVVQNPLFLDKKEVVICDEQGKPQQLDVDSIHTPVWYSLESEGQTRFIRSNAGATCDESWKHRPRLLLAAGFSFCPRWKTAAGAVDFTRHRTCTMTNIRAKDSVSYNITLDVLGLRSIRESLFQDDMKLQISSYWTNSEMSTLSLDRSRVRKGLNGNSLDRTFRGEKVEAERFKQRAKGLLDFQENSDAEQEQEDAIPSPLSESKSSAALSPRDEVGSGAMKVVLSHAVGWRASLPMYTVPVVPYLQKDRDDAATAFGQPEEPPPKDPKDRRREKWHISGSDMPFVLLPDVVFQLLHDRTDCGTLCLHLPAKYGHLPQALRRIIRKAISTRTIDTEWTRAKHSGVWKPEWLELHENEEVEVLKHDVSSGWAYGAKTKAALPEGSSHDNKEGWFPDWVLDPVSGTNWTEISLKEFSKLTPESLKSVPRYEHLADPGDSCEFFVDVFAARTGKIRWNKKFQLGRGLLDQHLFTIEPEDEDEDPVAQFFNPADWMFGDPLCQDEPFDSRVSPTFSCETTQENKRRWDEPKKAKSLEDLEARYRSQMRPELQSEDSRQEKQGKISLQELRKMAASHRMRLMSKQHVPERIDSGPELKDNWHESVHDHTFLRQVGHRIEKSNSETGRLARLRMGIPKRKDREKQGAVNVLDIHGSCYEFTLLSNNMVKVSKDRRYQLALPAHRTLNISEDSTTRSVELAKDREPLQVGPEQFEKLKEALQLFRAGDEATDHADEVDDEETSEDQVPSYLTIRYRQSGRVVWVAPPAIFRWQEPGSLLFIVEEDSMKHVAVRLPSFDLRFEKETSWYPAKIISSAIDIREMRQRLMKTQQQTMNATKGSQKGQVPVKEPKSDIRTISETICVQKNSFCCRLKMVGGRSLFDRPRTNNWYRTVLCDVFPEVKRLRKVEASMDAELVKHFFLQKHMNIRQPLVLQGREACLLKGHIHLEQVHDRDLKGKAKGTESSSWFGWGASKEQANVLAKEHVNSLPLPHLWVQSGVKLRVSVLTVRGLVLDSDVSLDSANIQLAVKLNGRAGAAKILEADSHVNRDGRGFDVYSFVTMDASLVGEAHLTFEVLAEGSWSSSKPIARAQIDLEDRWFALQQIRLRQVSNKRWILANLSQPDWRAKESCRRQTWLPQAHDGTQSKGSDESPPYLATAIAEPIETLPLFHPDPLFSDRRVGALRMWVDLVQEDDPLPEVSFNNRPGAEFEIRIRVTDVTGISVFKDEFGERNDVYVKAELAMKSPGDGLQRKTFRTDTHKYAREKACFNFEWMFKVPAPMHFCSVEFFLLDEDIFTDNDEIYESKVVPMDALIMKAYHRYNKGHVVRQKVQHEVWFETPSLRKRSEDDQAPLDEDPELARARADVRRCCRCCRCCKCWNKCWRKICRCCTAVCCFWCPTIMQKDVTPAVLKLEVEILSLEEAAEDPLARESGRFAEPTERLDWTCAITAPKKFFFNYIGPSNYYLLRRTVYCTTTLVCMLLVLGVVYLLLQILMPSLELKAKIDAM